MSSNIEKLKKELASHKSKQKAQILSRFFKTGKGEYGEGDIFLGITVPKVREVAKKYSFITLPEVGLFIKSPFHEERLAALLVLVDKYRSFDKVQDELAKSKIVKFYLKNTKYINNWDLVDLSAHYTLGQYLINKDKKILIKLAKSKSIWERRIAIISTFAFIYNNESEWTFRIVDMLLKDKHDLIQKACGWMLREVGKRVSEKELISYLDKNHHLMPRTTLRYAIERLPKKTRLYYLHLS